MKPARLTAILAALAALCFGAAAWAALVLPPLNGRRVVDDAGILSPAAEVALTRELADLESGTGRQVVIATLPSLQGASIEDYGYRLGRAWAVGSRERNDGLLLIVAPKERKVRIEVGYGLEAVMTDALASAIIQTTILPRFRTGDLEGGIVAGNRAIVAQLKLPGDEAVAVARTVPPTRARDSWWVRPLIKLSVVMVVTVFLPLLWSFFSGLFSNLWGRRPTVIRRRSRGMIDWNAGSFGGGPSAGSGGFSGGGGSFGGGGASGSW